MLTAQEYRAIIIYAMFADNLTRCEAEKVATKTINSFLDNLNSKIPGLID